VHCLARPAAACFCQSLCCALWRAARARGSRPPRSSQQAPPRPLRACAARRGAPATGSHQLTVLAAGVCTAVGRCAAMHACAAGEVTPEPHRNRPSMTARLCAAKRMQTPGHRPRRRAGAGAHLGRGAARPRPAAPPCRSRPLHTRPTARPARRAPARAGSAGVGRPCAARAPLGSAPRAAGPPATRPEQSARAQKHRACVRLPDTTCDLIQLPCAPEPNSPPPSRLCTLSSAAAAAARRCAAARRVACFCTAAGACMR